jgi:hypothetical protein
MKISSTTVAPRAALMRRFIWVMPVAALAVSHIASVHAEATQQSGVQSGARVAVLAMRWFKDIQAGRTDRSEYASAYAAQLTDDAVKGMSRALNRYGASPLSAEIVQTRKRGEQTFYTVKFIFPRGDATSLLFGFDSGGKITGIAIGGLAGD